MFQAEKCWPALTSSPRSEERVLPLPPADLLHARQGGGGADSDALRPDPGHAEGCQKQCEHSVFRTEVAPLQDRSVRTESLPQS